MRLPFFLLSLLLLAGCDSMPTRVRDRFTPVSPKMEMVDGDIRTVYLAAQTAFKRLDYTLTESALNRAHIEAASRISSNSAFGDARQVVANLSLREAAPGKIQIALLLTQQVEDSSSGGADQRPLKESLFYQTYFATLKQVLAEQTAPAKG